MSEKQPKYSDPEDGMDYQVIRSYGRSTGTPIRKSFVYALVVVIVLFLIIRCNGGQASDLETKVTNLESQKNNAESQP